MKKIKYQFFLWGMKPATELTITGRKINRSRQSLFILLFILFAILTAPWTQAMATSITLEFETQGLNLKTGTVVKILPRPVKETARVDIIIAYNADVTPHAVLMLEQAGMEMAVLKDVAFGQVKADSIAKLSFTAKFIDQPLKQSNTVVLRTADGSVYKIGDMVEGKTSVTFSYEILQKGRE